MEVHPVVVRALQWKFGEVKLSKEEEEHLAIDFYRLVSDLPVPVVRVESTTARSFRTRRPDRLTPQPKTMIEAIMRVIGDSRMTPRFVFQRFQQLNWKGSEDSIRKCIYRHADKNGEGELRRVGDGLYAISR